MSNKTKGWLMVLTPFCIVITGGFYIHLGYMGLLIIPVFLVGVFYFKKAFDLIDE